MQLNRYNALAAALLGAATLFPVPSFALNDDADIEVETDRDRPDILPGEPLDDPDVDVYVEVPEADADAGAQLETDDSDVDVDLN